MLPHSYRLLFVLHAVEPWMLFQRLQYLRLIRAPLPPQLIANEGLGGQRSRV